MNLNLTGKRAIFSLCSVLVLGFILGIIVYHLASSGSSSQADQTSENMQGMKGESKLVSYENMAKKKSNDEMMKDVQKKIIERMDRKKIKDNLRYLTERPHIAGGKRDEELATFIQERFKQSGFDHTEMLGYNVLLSYPDQNKPNKIILKRGNAKLFESHHMEDPIHPDDKDPEFVHAFNAYTPAGSITTEVGVGVVYVNYGRIEDFKKLEELGVNASGHIVMVRYGKIFRGNKVQHAYEYGARGVIIFSDPEDVAPEGTEPKDVYDNTHWLPGTGMQRGSTFIGTGDPLTPGWPSTEHAYRLSKSESKLPKIPAQPIGYDDAREILKNVDGAVAPEEWQGGIKGFQYRLGPLFNSEYKDVTLTLTTHNYEEINNNYNVFGYIKGSVEPDRYVILGNHRDAWGFGASDPSSGTAQLLESARVLGTLLKDGWRPRRTIIFCSWGAEEHGLIGSTEWVEEHIDKLSLRGVAHLNTDTCVSGSAPYFASSPLMWDSSLHISKMIPGAMDSSKTLFDEWKEYERLRSPQENEIPVFKGLGSGSDHAAFTFYVGMPAARFDFRVDKNKMHNISTYAYYHTGYETFYMISRIDDPDFKFIQGCGRFASLYITYFADSPVLPYSIERLPMEMMKGLKEFKHRQKLISIYDKYMELEKAIERLMNAAKEFKNKLELMEPDMEANPLMLRAINDQLMKLEQVFILKKGLPRREQYEYKHSLFSPSVFDKYASTGFPGLSDLLYDYDDLQEGKAKMEREKQIQIHISDLTIMTDRATSLLKDVHLV